MPTVGVPSSLHHSAGTTAIVEVRYRLCPRSKALFPGCQLRVLGLRAGAG